MILNASPVIVQTAMHFITGANHPLDTNHVIDGLTIFLYELENGTESYVHR